MDSHADKQMRAVAILLNNLESVDGGLVPHNVVKLHWPILLDPEKSRAEHRGMVYEIL